MDCITDHPCLLVISRPNKKTINFTIGLSLGPYILSNGDGILGDIINESLSQSGYLVNFTFNSNAEAIKAYTNKQFDAVAVVKPGLAPGYFSGPVISLQQSLNHTAIKWHKDFISQ